MAGVPVDFAGSFHFLTSLCMLVLHQFYFFLTCVSSYKKRTFLEIPAAGKGHIFLTSNPLLAIFQTLT